MKHSAYFSALLLAAGLAAQSHGSQRVIIIHGLTISELRTTPPATNAWWRADHSMKAVNEAAVERRTNGRPEWVVESIGWWLIEEPYRMLTRTDEYYLENTPKMLEALYRSGDDPQITNILHRALLAPTNHYREATFRAYVMASPVPMTALAETVVRHVPADVRGGWYLRASEKAWRGDPAEEKTASRESLRLAHFLSTAKAAETDPACLRAIGNPADPGRDTPAPPRHQAGTRQGRPPAHQPHTGP